MFIVFYRWNISKMVLTLLYQYWIQKLNIEYSTISVSYETIKLRLFPGYSILYARRMPIWVSSIQCYSTDSNKNLNGHSPMVLKVWKFERTPTQLLINFNAIRSLLFQDIYAKIKSNYVSILLRLFSILKLGRKFMQPMKQSKWNGIC